MGAQGGTGNTQAGSGRMHPRTTARALACVADRDAPDAAADRILLRAFWTSPARHPGIAKVVSFAAVATAADVSRAAPR